MTRPVLRALSAAAMLAVTGGLLPAASVGAADVPVLQSVPTPADGVFRMTGSGWGHGRGMSQWGAYEAATEGRSFVEILAFYYPGTVLSQLESGTVRVLLSGDTGRDLIVRAVRGMTATQTGADPVVLPTTPAKCGTPATRWRVRATGSVLRLSAYCRGWRAVDRVAGKTLAFDSPTGIVGTQNGSIRRGYRGTVTASLVGSKSLQVTNTLPLEEYLRAVVPSEVSPSWPAEALRAQAVAARSYAAYEIAAARKRAFDVYDSTRSQAYPGAVSYTASWKVASTREHSTTDQAIAGTAGLVATSNGVPALTQFSASNGGVSASTTLPYLVAAVDGWDSRATRNPRLAWTDTISAAALRKRFPAAGSIAALEVLGAEGPGAYGLRLTAVRIVGSARSYVVSGDTAIRSVLGVNSSVLTFVPPA